MILPGGQVSAGGRGVDVLGGTRWQLMPHRDVWGAGVLPLMLVGVLGGCRRPVKREEVA